MNHRKLRIAWSVGWGMAAVLPVAFWYRSIWLTDSIAIPLPNAHVMSLASVPGACGIAIRNGNNVSVAKPWGRDTISTTDFATMPSPIADISAVSGRFAYFYINTAGPVFIAPDWFLIVVTIALSGTPWLHWSNRFSLRTLLIATTLVAAGLGMIVWLTSK